MPDSIDQTLAEVAKEMGAQHFIDKLKNIDGKKLHQRIVLLRIRNKLGHIDCIANPNFFTKSIKDYIKNNPRIMSSLMEFGMSHEQITKFVANSLSHHG